MNSFKMCRFSSQLHFQETLKKWFMAIKSTRTQKDALLSHLLKYCCKSRFTHIPCASHTVHTAGGVCLLAPLIHDSLLVHGTTQTPFFPKAKPEFAGLCTLGFQPQELKYCLCHLGSEKERKKKTYTQKTLQPLTSHLSPPKKIEYYFG